MSHNPTDHDDVYYQGQPASPACAFCREDLLQVIHLTHNSGYTGNHQRVLALPSVLRARRWLRSHRRDPLVRALVFAERARDADAAAEAAFTALDAAGLPSVDPSRTHAFEITFIDGLYREGRHTEEVRRLVGQVVLTAWIAVNADRQRAADAANRAIARARSLGPNDDITSFWCEGRLEAFQEMYDDLSFLLVFSARRLQRLLPILRSAVDRRRAQLAAASAAAALARAEQRRLAAIDALIADVVATDATAEIARRAVERATSADDHDIHVEH